MSIQNEIYILSWRPSHAAALRWNGQLHVCLIVRKIPRGHDYITQPSAYFLLKSAISKTQSEICYLIHDAE